MKFALILLAAIIGNGLGAWNIRAISSGRYNLTAILTMTASMVQGTAAREIARDDWVYVMAWSIGSVIGITGSIWVDKAVIAIGDRWRRRHEVAA